MLHGAMTSPSTPRAAKVSASSRSRTGSSSEEPANDQHAARAGDVLDPAEHRREERVRDVLDDDADAGRRAVAAPQRARGQIAPVAEDLDGIAHARDQVRPDVDVPVHDARHRGETDPGQRGHVLHRRTASSVVRRVHSRLANVLTIGDNTPWSRACRGNETFSEFPLTSRSGWVRPCVLETLSRRWARRGDRPEERSDGNFHDATQGGSLGRRRLGAGADRRWRGGLRRQRQRFGRQQQQQRRWRRWRQCQGRPDHQDRHQSVLRQDEGGRAGRGQEGRRRRCSRSRARRTATTRARSRRWRT